MSIIVQCIMSVIAHISVKIGFRVKFNHPSKATPIFRVAIEQPVRHNSAAIKSWYTATAA